jgi:hypothetical protein
MLSSHACLFLPRYSTETGFLLPKSLNHQFTNSLIPSQKFLSTGLFYAIFGAHG